MSLPLRPGRGGLLLAVRVTPKSSRDQVMGFHTDSAGNVSLAVKVTAPPDKGKANRAVIETIASAAGVPKSSLSLAAGETERNKTILVTGHETAVADWVASLTLKGED